MKKGSGEPNARYFAFLRRLRAGGRSNMYGAIPYLMARFAIDRDTAFRVVCEWVDRQADERSVAGGSQPLWTGPPVRRAV